LSELQEIVMAERAAALTSFVAAAFVAVTASNAWADYGTAEQRWACEHDAFAFCSSEIPDVKRITACMLKNLKKLSPPCRAQFREKPAHGRV
jgi:ubiquinone biosynthesis protein UbiJ